MTDKERIEEMARIIHFNYWGNCRTDSCSDCPHSNLNICDDEKIAEKLYNKLFPEGSVVLSKDEAQKYYAYKHIEPQIKGCLDREVILAKQLDKARKETAREIFKELYKQISANHTVALQNEYNDWKYAKLIERYAKHFYVDLIKRYAKQFDVEVEE